MRRFLLGLSFGIVTSGAVLVAVGCSGADEHPLGGPYGGTGNAANTSSGSTGSSGDGSSSGDNASSGGSTSSGSTSSGGSTSGGSTSGSSGNSSGGSTSSSSGGTSSGGTSSGGSSGGPPAAPTWTQIWTNYLKSGTVGNCSHCHGSTGSASGAYNWLKNKGYISGTSSALVDPNRSCLTWYGGNMPTNGATSPQAAKDMNAWAAAGAANN
jgi:hypothetical protein